jgi:hypothetical protein
VGVVVVVVATKRVTSTGLTIEHLFLIGTTPFSSLKLIVSRKRMSWPISMKMDLNLNVMRM